MTTHYILLVIDTVYEAMLDPLRLCLDLDKID